MTQTALVLIDFQEEWTNPQSEYYIGDIQEVIAKVNYLIDHCRTRGYKIIFTKHREIDALDYFGPETKFIPLLNGEETDTIIIKNKISPFYNTSLEKELDGIKHVIVCGILTNLCVRSFIQDAYDREFKITVIKDCCVAHTEEIQEFTFYDLAQTREEIDFTDLREFVE
ncbi:MAG TPA: isochorismatase family cysteine hydrolase [Candidatus Absconditabacterales bacterium]|nr:isochorismatase family cysteine hydrolase [Candidatus Absconditabacterales bacterium]